MSNLKEEVFGPIDAVTSFETEEEVVKLANDSSYGLAASFYTKDLKQLIQLENQILAGTVSINGS